MQVWKVCLVCYGTSNEWNSSITGWISFQLIMYLFRNCYIIFEFFIKARACEALVVETTSIHFWNIYLIDTIRHVLDLLEFTSSFPCLVWLCCAAVHVCLFGFWLIDIFYLNMYLLILATYQHRSFDNNKKVTFWNFWVHPRH